MPLRAAPRQPYFQGSRSGSLRFIQLGRGRLFRSYIHDRERQRSALDECRKVATDIAGCVPETVKVYKQVVNDGLQTDLAAGLTMERNVMAYVNQRVSGDAIATRRAGVQKRGQKQQSS